MEVIELAAHSIVFTSSQPCELIGARAAAQLLKRMKDPSRHVKAVRLQAERKIRNSCGCG